MVRYRWMALVGVAAMTAACAHGRFGPKPSTKVPEGIAHAEEHQRQRASRDPATRPSLATDRHALAQPLGRATAPVRREDWRNDSPADSCFPTSH